MATAPLSQLHVNIGANDELNGTLCKELINFSINVPEFSPGLYDTSRYHSTLLVSSGLDCDNSFFVVLFFFGKLLLCRSGGLNCIALADLELMTVFPLQPKN